LLMGSIEGASFNGSIRNSNGIWINTQVFREEAEHFKKHGYYCGDPKGTQAHRDYWGEQLRRCKEGYSVGGCKITGDHYGYLNFAQIKLTDESGQVRVVKSQRGKSAKKIITFPDFWDGDYDYWHTLDIAENGIEVEDYIKLQLGIKIDEEDLIGGKHVCVGKARRKGYSYKNGWKSANRYNTIRDSVTLLGAFDKKYLYQGGDGIMVMALNYLNFINEHTGWAKRRLIDKNDFVKAGFTEYNDENIPIEKGYKSQLVAISFKDNPDAARGKDASLVLFEEAGKFPNLKDAVLATKPTMEDGIYTTGMMLIFGTGGKDASGWLGFNEIFNDPKTYNFMAFENTWDEELVGTKCSYFFPNYKNKPGFIDLQGNSLFTEAKESDVEERSRIVKNSKDSTVIKQHMTEYPWNPREAFSLSLGNIFPVPELTTHLNKLNASKDGHIEGTHGSLVLQENGTVKFEPDLTGNMNPADYPAKEGQTEGCVTIWEPPQLIDGLIPFGLYLAGTDPYDQDKAPNSPSLGSTFIYKTFNAFGGTYDIIVAEYTGRPNTAQEHHETVRKLLLYYNAKDLYENEKNTMKMHFEHKHSLHLLVDTPNILKSTTNSSVNRGKGIHMTPAIKEELEIYFRDWLSTERGDGKLNLHTIMSKPLLRELIAYNKEGNFDRVIAVMLTNLNRLNNTFIKVKEAKKKETDPFFKKRLFV
jgi:hypothetical protein